MIPAIVFLASALAAGEAPKSQDPFVGRWNVRITDATDTFVSGGFDIESTEKGLQAAIVWRWAGVVKAKTVQESSGALRMVREPAPGKEESFEARLNGDTISGKVTYADGKVHHFEGRRAPELLRAEAPQWGRPIVLFDGKSLAGWSLRDPKARLGWAALNGELAVVDPEGNADLVSTPTFRDFKLHIEFNVDPHSNSGVYLRGRDEIQILDEPAEALAVTGCGALYGRIAPKVDVTKAPGEWQVYDISLVGRNLTVVLNGTTVIDQATMEGITGGALSPFEDEAGPIMLQGDHGKVRFRNIVITPAL